MGPGKATLLFKAGDAVELEDNRDGVIHVVQARLARKTWVPRVCKVHCAPAIIPSEQGVLFAPWDRSRLAVAGPQDSEHSHCGYHTRDDALWSSSSCRAQAGQGIKSNESFECVYREKPTALGK